jgi:hypothetical protein
LCSRSSSCTFWAVASILLRDDLKLLQSPLFAILCYVRTRLDKNPLDGGLSF